MRITTEMLLLVTQWPRNRETSAGLRAGILLRQPYRYVLFMQQFVLLKYQHKKEPIVVNADEMSIVMSHPNIFRGFAPRVCDMKVHNASKI